MTPTPSQEFDTYEDRIERAIFRADDLYDLDGEILFRRRNGTVETFGPEVEP